MSTKQINILNELNDSSEMLDLIINQLENNKYNISTIDYSKTFSRIEKYLWTQKYYNTHKFLLFTRIILDNINSIKIDNDVIGILIESADILHSLKLMGNDVDSIFKDEEYIFTDICIYLGKILYKNGLTLPHKEELNNLYKDKPVKKPVRRIISKTQNKQSLKEEISSYNQRAITFDERAKMIIDYKLYLPNFSFALTAYSMYLLSKENDFVNTFIEGINHNQQTFNIKRALSQYAILGNIDELNLSGENENEDVLQLFSDFNKVSKFSVKETERIGRNQTKYKKSLNTTLMEKIRNNFEQLYFKFEEHKSVLEQINDSISKLSTLSSNSNLKEYQNLYYAELSQIQIIINELGLDTSNAGIDFNDSFKYFDGSSEVNPLHLLKNKINNENIRKIFPQIETINFKSSVLVNYSYASQFSYIMELMIIDILDKFKNVIEINSIELDLTQSLFSLNSNLIFSFNSIDKGNAKDVIKLNTIVKNLLAKYLIQGNDTNLNINYNLSNSSIQFYIEIPIIPAKLDVITIYNGASEFSFLISDVESILSVNTNDIIQDSISRKIIKHNIEVNILDSFSFLEGNLFGIINPRQKLIIFKQGNEHYGILCTGKILKSTISSDMLSLGKRNEILYEFSDNSIKYNYVFDINSIIDNYKKRFIKLLESTKAS